MKIIKGGVCASKGFKASGIHCGIRKNRTKRDLSLIISEKESNVACIYTTNLVKGAPIYVTQSHLKNNGNARCIICNSGNANTCNQGGEEVAEKISKALAKEFNINSNEVVVASTGVIGQPLDPNPIINNLSLLKKELGSDEEHSVFAAEGIMTTDVKLKQIAIEFEIDGKTVHMGAIAKGSGMIHPDMATMLVFITTDCSITNQMLQKALHTDVSTSFNMVSIDGDTSTNDMVCILANGMAENKKIEDEGKDFDIFMKALNTVTIYLCKSIASDGEGATKMIECSVKGALDNINAKIIAKSVVCSSLVKAAMFGCDANWGRILCAIGYSKAKVDVKKISVSFKSDVGIVDVCKKGVGIVFSEDTAKKVLSQKNIEILIGLGDGEGECKAWGCDLTYDYVKINGDYRT